MIDQSIVKKTVERILESIMYVDEVVIFDSTKELQDLYETLSPEVVVKGSEWTANEKKNAMEYLMVFK